MKHARSLMITALLITGLCVFAQAQERTLLTANVPFSFTVGTTDMPAGTYTVYTLAPYNMIRIQSANAQNLAMVSAIPQPSAQAEQGKLVFHRVGSHYFLAQITEQGGKVNREIRTNSFTRELAKNGGKMQTTTVLASANSSH